MLLSSSGSLNRFPSSESFNSLSSKDENCISPVKSLDSLSNFKTTNNGLKTEISTVENSSRSMQPPKVPPRPSQNDIAAWLESKTEEVTQLRKDYVNKPVRVFPSFPGEKILRKEQTFAIWPSGSKTLGVYNPTDGKIFPTLLRLWVNSIIQYKDTRYEELNNYCKINNKWKDWYENRKIQILRRPPKSAESVNRQKRTPYFRIWSTKTGYSFMEPFNTEVFQTSNIQDLENTIGLRAEVSKNPPFLSSIETLQKSEEPSTTNAIKKPVPKKPFLPPSIKTIQTQIKQLLNEVKYLSPEQFSTVQVVDSPKNIPTNAIAAIGPASSREGRYFIFFKDGDGVKEYNGLRRALGSLSQRFPSQEQKEKSTSASRSNVVTPRNKVPPPTLPKPSTIKDVYGNISVFIKDKWVTFSPPPNDKTSVDKPPVKPPEI